MGLRAKSINSARAKAVVNTKLINGQTTADKLIPKKSIQQQQQQQQQQHHQQSIAVKTAASATTGMTAAAAAKAKQKDGATDNACITTTTTTTYRSSSTSAIVPAMAANCMRPQTLNVQHMRETPTIHTQLFFREVLSAWRAKARCNVVPAERTQELFHELSFHPSDKQISEMLQTAKLLARKGSRQSNGLTFGEFCVLAADLKRFRSNSTSPFCERVNLLSALHPPQGDKNATKEQVDCDFAASPSLRSTKSLSNVGDCNQTVKNAKDITPPVEVFLGGSCNPTTWRADVAIPALQELGISFYNPQVSDWTPDLIELEHRAKEKARVLFFVMDSETRASAGAIEAAHIAGQNCKQLVLVLHPYKTNQYILNEPISQQEYLDLMRNQMMLQELVTRRGLPVLDNIPSGLQRTKEILAGFRDPPMNIASILLLVRGAFERVSPNNEFITVEQCQRALSHLGYAQSLIKLDNLNKIIASQRESLSSLEQYNYSTKRKSAQGNNINNTNNTNKIQPTSPTTGIGQDIDFNLFCVISAYLSVLQQEIQESGCISPIKGTNVPPPPIYLANMQSDENFALISRTSSNNSMPSSVSSNEDRQSLNDSLIRSRDSGTSSPQPQEAGGAKTSHGLKPKTQIMVNVESIEMTTEITTLQTLHTSAHTATPPIPIPDHMTFEEESDSTDSVFSSNSSINSVNCNYNADMLSFSTADLRDVYLGGSCAMRTKWRNEIAIPYLKSKKISYHLPALHESLSSTAKDLTGNAKNGSDAPPTRTIETQERSFTSCTRRQCRSAQLEEEVEEKTTVSEESVSWSPLPRMRLSLYNPALLDSSRVLLFVITNETRSLAPMTLAAHCIGLMYNVVLAVQMLPDDCVIGNEKLTSAAIKDYNRGRSYLIDLAKRQEVPVFNDLKAALECTVEKVKAFNSRQCRFD